MNVKIINVDFNLMITKISKPAEKGIFPFLVDEKKGEAKII